MAKQETTIEDVARSVAVVSKSVEVLTQTVSTVSKSVEDLARITQEGFLEQSKRFDRIEAVQSKHGERLDKIDVTLVGHGNRLDKMDGILQDHSLQFALLKLSVKDLRTEVAHLTKLIEQSTNQADIIQFKQRVTILEAELAKR